MNPIQYVAELTTIPAGRLPMERGGRFFANLTNIERMNGKVADMTTSLMIAIHGIDNRTNITCRIQTGDFLQIHISSTLYITGLLYT